MSKTPYTFHTFQIEKAPKRSNLPPFQGSFRWFEEPQEAATRKRANPAQGEAAEQNKRARVEPDAAPKPQDFQGKNIFLQEGAGQHFHLKITEEGIEEKHPKIPACLVQERSITTEDEKKESDQRKKAQRRDKQRVYRERLRILNQFTWQEEKFKTSKLTPEQIAYIEQVNKEAQNTIHRVSSSHNLPSIHEALNAIPTGPAPMMQGEQLPSFHHLLNTVASPSFFVPAMRFQGHPQHRLVNTKENNQGADLSYWRFGPGGESQG